VTIDCRVADAGFFSSISWCGSSAPAHVTTVKPRMELTEVRAFFSVTTLHPLAFVEGDGPGYCLHMPWRLCRCGMSFGKKTPSSLVLTTIQFSMFSLLAREKVIIFVFVAIGFHSNWIHLRSTLMRWFWGLCLGFSWDLTLPVSSIHGLGESQMRLHSK